MSAFHFNCPAQPRVEKKMSINQASYIPSFNHTFKVFSVLKKTVANNHLATFYFRDFDADFCFINMERLEFKLKLFARYTTAENYALVN